MLRAFGPTARIAGAGICVVLAVVMGACGGKSQDASAPSAGCAPDSSPELGHCLAPV